MSDQSQHNVHHEHMIKEVRDMLEPLLSNSPQAIYVYLDDIHKFCNQKFADLVGYGSVDEWEKNEFPLSDVEEKDQEKVIKAYTEASEHFKASTVDVAVVKKDGTKLNVHVIMAPFSYNNEAFVTHYISPKK